MLTRTRWDSSSGNALANVCATMPPKDSPHHGRPVVRAVGSAYPPDELVDVGRRRAVLDHGEPPSAVVQERSDGGEHGGAARDASDVGE